MRSDIDESVQFTAGKLAGDTVVGDDQRSVFELEAKPISIGTVAGEPLVFSQAFLRSVGGLLQLLPMGLGYLAILSSPERRGWNDQLAGTRLISLREGSEEA